MDVQKKIEQLQSELDRVKRELKESNTNKPIKGAWYIGRNFTSKFLFKLLDDKDGYCYVCSAWIGLSDDFEGMSVFDSTGHINDIGRRATPEEIEEALTEEAKRRYGVPCDIKYIDGRRGGLQGYALVYDEITDALYASHDEDVVYQDGEWAEVIEGEDRFFDCDMEDHGFMVEIDGHTYSTFMIDDMIQILGAVPDKTAREIIDEFNRLEI